MLTRSSVPPSPVNEPSNSPCQALRHAPPPSPFHQFSSRLSGSLFRRPSTSSTSVVIERSPTQSRVREYVGVDAATQYSPMEPPGIDSGEGRACPQLLGVDSDPASSTTAPDASTCDAECVIATSSTLTDRPDPTHLTSPSKRRKSQGVVGADDVPQSTSPISKRVRQDAPSLRVLPHRYEFCPVEDMVVLIANMLGELIETNDALALKSGNLTRFHSRTAPGISVLDYLHRLAKHATLTPPLLLCMVYYIDRLCISYPDFTINTLTVHRFLITAATVAAKGLSDSFWNNSTYARVGGVRVAELKLLELEFLYRVDWKIVPNPEVLVAYYRGLVERCPHYVLSDEDEPGDEADDSDDIEEDDEVEDEGREDAGTAEEHSQGGQ